MRSLYVALGLALGACSSPPSTNDSGSAGGGGGVSSAGGGSGGGAGGTGGGSGGLCLDARATCQAHGAQCGEAALDCGRIDCGTCSIGSLTGPRGTPEHLAMAGLPRGVVVATGGRLGVGLLVPQGAGAPDYDGGYVAVTVPDAGAENGEQSLSVAAAADGTIWVAYVTGSPSRVYVASSATGFAPESIAEGGSVAVTVDRQGQPRVAYSAFAAQTGIYEARLDGGVWVSSFAAPATRDDVGLGIAVDSQGRSHLLYITDLMGAVAHTVATPSGYTTEPVSPGGGADFHRAAISAGVGDELHAVWSTGGLRYGHRTDAGWSTMRVPRLPATGFNVTVATRGGHAQLAFVDDDFAYYGVPIGDAGFAIQRLHQTQANRSAIAVDGEGTVHVASVDSTPGAMGLKIWKFTGKYPDGYADKFRQIGEGLCSKARECLGDAGTYCLQYSVGDSCAAPFSSCVGGVITRLWSVTVDAGLVDACLAAVPSAQCGTVRMPPRPAAIAPPQCTGLPH